MSRIIAGRNVLLAATSLSVAPPGRARQLISVDARPGRRRRSTRHATPHLAQSRAARLAAAVAVVAAAGACSSPPPENRTVPEPSAPVSSSAPPRQTKAWLPTGGDVYRNATTVYSGCIPDLRNADSIPSGQILDTETGQNLPLPLPELPASDEVLRHACTVATTSDGKQRVIHVITTRTPSHGLTPESEQSFIVALDVKGNRAPITKPLPAELADMSGIYPANNGFVAIDRGPNGTEAFAWFDINTIEPKIVIKLDTDVGVPPETEPIDMVPFNYDGYATILSPRIPCGDCGQPEPGFSRSQDLHFFDGPSGAEIGVFRNIGHFVPVDHGYLMEHETRLKAAPPSDLQAGVFYFDMRTKELSGPIAPYIWVPNNYFPRIDDPEFGNALIWDDNVMLIGPDTDSGLFLKVWNRKSKTEIFSLTGPQLAGLKINGLSLGPTDLLIENESDSPVIDLKTGKPVAAGWSLKPVARLDDGWVVIKPGKPGDSEGWLCISSYTQGCPTGASYPAGAYLARGVNGDYAGPWH